MLEIWLHTCQRWGITEVLLNVHANADAIRAVLDRERNGVRVQISEEAVLLGSAGTLLANRKWVDSESHFWVFYADVLTTANLKEMLELHCRRAPVATIGLYQVPDPSRCGVVTFDSDFVVRDFVEKPTRPASNWAFSGLMIATPELLNIIPNRFPVDLGFHVLPRLIGRMLACPLTDYVVDIGTMQNYQAAQTTWPGFNH
jgi:mannose-1-phosphate guanylyltransferase